MAGMKLVADERPIPENFLWRYPKKPCMVSSYSSRFGLVSVAVKLLIGDSPPPVPRDTGDIFRALWSSPAQAAAAPNRQVHRPCFRPMRVDEEYVLLHSTNVKPNQLSNPSKLESFQSFQLAEPLIKQHGKTAERAEAIIMLTIAGWNKSMFPTDKQPTIEKDLIDCFVPKDGSAEAVDMAIEVMDDVVEQREKLFPDVQKIIVDYEAEISGGRLTLNVASAPIPDLG